PVAPPCSCRLLSHQTLLWHHRRGHPSLPCLRGMHSRLLVSGLPRSLHPFFNRFGCTNIFPSQDVTFDESVPFYRLFPYCSAPPPPPPLFLAPGPPPVDPLPPQGPAPSGVSQVDPLPGTVPVEVAGDSGAARGAASGGAESEGAGSRGAEPGGAELGCTEPGGAELGCTVPAGVEPGGAKPEGVEPGGAEFEGAESGGVEPRGTASSGGPAGALPRVSPRPEPLSLQQLREWFAQRTRLRSGAAGAGDFATGDSGDRGAGPIAARTRVTGAAGIGSVWGAGAAGIGGAGVGSAGAGGTGAGGVGAGGAGAGGIGASDAGAGGAGAGDTGAVDPGAGGAGAGGAVSGGTGAGGTVRPRPHNLRYPASPWPAPSHYIEPTGGLTERRVPASRPFSPVRTARHIPRPRPPPVPGSHAMALRPSSVPLHVPLPPPPESSLPAIPNPESDRARATSPTVSRLLATVVSDPSFESSAASALVAELSASASPSSIGGECALGTDVLEDKQEDFECLAAAVPRFASMLLAPVGNLDAPDIPTPRSYAEAIMGPYSSQWQAAMDAEMASWKFTGTYVDVVPPSWANIVDGMWIFRVKRPPGSPPAIKARYVARGLSQRHGVEYFQTFSPTPKMTTLWAPREWHDTLRTTLAAMGFTPSTANPSLFLRIDTSLPPFYVLVYVDDLVFATADTEALTLVKSELQKRDTCTDLGELRSYLGLQITRDRARHTITLTQSHMVHQVLQRFGFQFSSPQPNPWRTGSSCGEENWKPKR
ncbi:unnamed protein product, partial [Closterium sp. NIES-54]